MKNFSETLLFIKQLDGWLSSHEAYFLYNVAKGAKGKGEIVEIGSWKGKSTICLSSGSENAKIYAVDPHKGEYSKGKGLGKGSPTYKEFLNNLKNGGVKEKVIPLVTMSEDAAKKWKSPIKLLFIDGLHDYKHTKQDYDLWSPFVVSNGVIAFHDAFCGHTGPERVILEDILTNQSYKEIGVVGSIIYARKGKPSFFERINLAKNKLLITAALSLNKKTFPLKFITIHKFLKLFLMNTYTYHILTKKV